MYQNNPEAIEIIKIFSSDYGFDEFIDTHFDNNDNNLNIVSNHFIIISN